MVSLGSTPMQWTPDPISGNMESMSLTVTRLHHFLYMGIEGNCYQPGKQVFTLENVHSLTSLIQDGRGEEVVREAARFAKEGLSLCPDAPMYALAVCAHSADRNTKAAAFTALQEVCRTPQQLFAFTRYMEEVSRPTTGWGRAQRKAISAWYNGRSGKELAAQVTTTVCRHRWKHRDILRLAHVKAKSQGVAVVLKYLLRGFEAAEKECEKEGTLGEALDTLAYLRAVHQLKHATDEHIAARLIETHDLSFQQVPSHLLKSKEVWTALVPRLPLSSLLQQLPRLNRLNLIKPNSHVGRLLLDRLRAGDDNPEGPLGPLQTFLALKSCEVSSNSSKLTRPIPRHRKTQLEDVLGTLHMASFKMVPCTGKRFLVAVDVRNPMAFAKVHGCSQISPAGLSSILLMALVRAEGNPTVAALAFSTRGMACIDLNSKMTHTDIAKRMRETPMGPVNIAGLLQWAQEQHKYFDVVVVCTDNQTQIIDIHPAEALKQYRRAMDLPHTRLVVCAMTSQGFSLAPPYEPGMLDIAGFDQNILQIIQDFARGVF